MTPPPRTPHHPDNYYKELATKLIAQSEDASILPGWKVQKDGRIGFEYLSTITGNVEIIALAESWSEVVEIELYRRNLRDVIHPQTESKSK